MNWRNVEKKINRVNYEVYIAEEITLTKSGRSREGVYQKKPLPSLLNA